jgi:glyoxylase-like metal-dependent hydrolase (beta-lactamase superfamily II)
MEKITKDVYLIKSAVANQYLIIDKEKLVLIDTGLKGNSKFIIKSIDELRMKIHQLMSIYITHADGDHYGSLKDLINASGAQSFASDIEASAIKKGVSSRGLKPTGVQKYVFSVISPLFRCEPVNIDKIINSGDVFPYLQGIEVLSTPGHTPGHLSFYAKKEKILFSGYSICINGRDLSPSTGANNWNDELSKKSFEYQISLKPKFIYGGHGFIEIK